MNVADLLLDGFGCIHHVVHQVLDDLTPESLDFRLDSKANSIAWLIWHLVRVQDDHIAEVAGRDQVWTALGYHDAVYAETVAFVRELSETDLDRIVYESWQPPVDLGTRLFSVISDDLQHAGQAAFIKGIAARAASR
jgi:uncharacterized damage-inducible protein DinB